MTTGLTPTADVIERILYDSVAYPMSPFRFQVRDAICSLVLRPDQILHQSMGEGDNAVFTMQERIRLSRQ